MIGQHGPPILFRGAEEMLEFQPELDFVNSPEDAAKAEADYATVRVLQDNFIARLF